MNGDDVEVIRGRPHKRVDRRTESGRVVGWEPMTEEQLREREAPVIERMRGEVVEHRANVLREKLATAAANPSPAAKEAAERESGKRSSVKQGSFMARLREMIGI